MKNQESPRTFPLQAAILFVLGLTLAAQAQTPTIISQPTSQTTITGGRAIFTVMAEGQAPLTHQWRRDGAAILGATNDVLILTNAQFADAEQYSVAVSNTLGGVESTNAALLVNWPRAGDVDFSFDPGSSIDGTIYSVAVQPDGKVLIAGSFTSVNDAVRGRVARLNADGTTDHTFMNGMSGANAEVYSITALQDGKVLIGGRFTSVNGAGRTNVARLNANGSVDTAFMEGKAGIHDNVVTEVRTVATQSDGKVLIGGSFRMYSFGMGGNVARLKPDGSFDSFVWGSGANSSVDCMVVQADGKVLIGGSFTDFSGVSCGRVVRLDSDGRVDPSFQIQMSGPTARVCAIAFQPDGKILIGGSFTTVNGISRNGITRLNDDGSLDANFLSGTSSYSVKSLALQPDGKILIGGSFNTIDGVSRNGIARLNADGSLDTTFQDRMNGANSGVRASMLEADGKVLIGGDFTTVNGVSRNRLARLNADGSLDTTFQDRMSGANSTVRASMLEADGKVLIGGDFTAVNGVNRNRLARLNADGSLDHAFLDGMDGADNIVDCVALQADDKVLIGGRFTAVNGESRTSIARLNFDGSVDTSFLSGMAGLYHELGGIAFALAQQPDGKVVVAGRFTAVNGESRTNIARLNEDGSLDTTFQNGMGGADGTVYTVALQTDAKVLIGGVFRAVNGMSRTNLARLNDDGSLDTSFVSGLAQQSGTVYCVTTLTNGQLLVGGTSGIARLNTDGSADPAFTCGTQGSIGSVSSVAIQEDGKLVVGRNFGVARLNANGSRDREFLWGLVGITGPASVALQPDGMILAWGDFGAVNGEPRGRIVRLHGSSVGPVWIAEHPLDQGLFAGGSATLSAVAVGAPPLAYQWLWNDSAIPGATNSGYAIPAIETNQGGNYRVVVTNALGSAESPNALLTVWPVVPLGEALDAPHLTWTTGGDAPWFGQTLVAYDGVDAARSGAIEIPPLGELSISWLETTVVGPGELSFRWKVSTCGGLQFYISGDTQGTPISRNTDWQRLTFNLPAGTHTLRWQFRNGLCPPVENPGPPQPPLEVEGCAWLDEVSFVPVGLPPFSLSHGARLPNGDYQIQLTGEPGREYTIQASTNLVYWVTLTNLISPTGLASFIDADAKLYPRRFYRAVAEVYTGPDLPVLIGIRQGGSMVLSWPASFAGFGLESTPTMSNPVWSPVVPAPAIVVDAYTVTNSIAGGSKFYRLRKQ